MLAIPFLWKRYASMPLLKVYKNYFAQHETEFGV